MTLSVIIPFYNAEETLADCLESLIAQTVPPFEVILVDNGSTDRSFSIAEKFLKEERLAKWRLVRELRQGSEYARNTGAAQAAGEILAFTDSDCVADPDWISEITRAFQSHPEAAAVAGRVRGYPPKNLVQKFLCLYTLRSAVSEEHLYRSYDLFQGGFPTANLAVRRHVFNQLKGFDADIPFRIGDIDFCARLYAAGNAILYTPLAAMRHQHRRTLKSMLRQSYTYGGVQATLLGSHFRRHWIVEVPGKTFRGQGSHFPLWLNLTYLDKKVLGGLLLTALWWPLGIFLIAILVSALVQSQKIAREENVSLSWLEAFGLLGLMLLKSAAMTCGRIAGSWKMKELCL